MFDLNELVVFMKAHPPINRESMIKDKKIKYFLLFEKKLKRK